MSAIDWHSKIADDFDSGYGRSPRFAERLKVLGSLIGQHLPQGGAFLDAGCGSGLFSLIAAERASRVVAFDGSPEMIALARSKVRPESAGSVTFDVAELADIARFGPGEFDVVLSSSVLEYVEDLDRALANHVAMLKPRGVFIVSMPNGDSLYRGAEQAVFAATGRPRYMQYVRHMPAPRHLAERLRAHGLAPISVETYSSAPVVGGAMRAMGLAKRFDTLAVIAARAS